MGCVEHATTCQDGIAGNKRTNFQGSAGDGIVGIRELISRPPLAMASSGLWVVWNMLKNDLDIISLSLIEKHKSDTTVVASTLALALVMKRKETGLNKLLEFGKRYKLRRLFADFFLQIFACFS